MKPLLINLIIQMLAIKLAVAHDPFYTNYRDSRYANLQLYTPYPTEIPPGTKCCNIPVCSKYGCFKSKVCGYLCDQGPYSTQDHGPTPGYRLIESYWERSCHFGECHDFKVDCLNCPDPGHPDFRIYNVKKSCASCYKREN